MRRSVALFALILTALAGTAPSRAETTMVVGAAMNEFVVGENDYGSLADTTTGVGIAVRHVKGNQLQFTNTDLVPHTLQSVLETSPGVPRFGSTSILLTGASADVRGVTTLAASATGYAFKCKLHPMMKGTLIIIAGP